MDFEEDIVIVTPVPANTVVVNATTASTVGPQGPQGLKGDTGATGPTGATGATGPSGIISVISPITNSGTSTSANIGLDQTALVITRNQITGTAITQTDTGTVSSTMLGTSVVQTYIQATAPTVSLGSKYTWWDNSKSSLTLWIEDGT